MVNIDWGMFKEESDTTCYCRCGKIFRSHAMYAKDLQKVISKDKCPSCLKNDNCWRYQSDPESLTLE